MVAIQLVAPSGTSTANTIITENFILTREPAGFAALIVGLATRLSLLLPKEMFRWNESVNEARYLLPLACTLVVMAPIVAPVLSKIGTDICTT